MFKESDAPTRICSKQKSTFNCPLCTLCHGVCVSRPRSYHGPARGCGHWQALEDLEGRAGLVDPSLLGVLVDHGGLRGRREDGNISVVTDMKYDITKHGLKSFFYWGEDGDE